MARLAQDAADIGRAQGLRHLSFRSAAGRDSDAFDAVCQHVLIEDVASGQLLGCCRLLHLADGAGLGASYSAQFYDLTPLQAYPGAMVEVGRFCLHPQHHDPDILRLAWAAITRIVEARAVTLMFGCTSFAGASALPHAQALALLSARYLAPPLWQPRVKSPEVVRLDAGLPVADAGRALAGVPPLLRSYLAMGAWVSDHAVIDRDLDTLHVFTGVEVARIPVARVRALRALAV
jgi:putative hemolysin